jgi:hypothetical protein
MACCFYCTSGFAHFPKDEPPQVFLATYCGYVSISSQGWWLCFGLKATVDDLDIRLDWDDSCAVKGGLPITNCTTYVLLGKETAFVFLAIYYIASAARTTKFLERVF